MATRLDRLTLLLDSGSTPGVRSTAASQIGQIAGQRPEDLHVLLTRVFGFLKSRSWDTRLAASLAMEAIAKNSSTWDPAPGQSTTTSHGDDEEAWMLSFASFDMGSVVKNGAPLLASPGKEFEDEDDGLSGLDPKERIARQKKQLKQKLGLGTEFMDVDFFEESDIKATSGQSTKGTTPAPAQSTKNALEEDASLAGLSARERNRLKRKAKLDLKNKGRAPTNVDLTSSSKKRKSISHDDIQSPSNGEATTEISNSEDKSNMVVVEHKTLDTSMLMNGGDEWPFEALCEQLCLDLFSPFWEVRHGAGLALREVLKSQGSGAGKILGVTKATNTERHASWMADLAIRLLCVLALDKFSDYVGDQAVVPVRETCAQTLGVVSQFASEELCQNIVIHGLLKLIQESRSKEATDHTSWGVRLAALTGLKYILAVRSDMVSQLLVAKDGTFSDVLKTIVEGLRDSNDDVRSVAATTLNPIANKIVDLFSPRIVFDSILSVLWDSLQELDDLTSATVSVMDLIARFVVQPQMDDILKKEAKSFLKHLVPQMYPFFRHAISSVRVAVLRTLRTFSQLDTSNAPRAWITIDLLRLIYQNFLLEENPDIVASSLELWKLLVSILLSDSKDEPLSTFFHASLKTFLGILMTPIGTPLNSRLFIQFSSDRLSSSSKKKTVLGSNIVRASGTEGMNVSPHDRAMSNQDFTIISKETVIHGRLAAAESIGYLLFSTFSSLTDDAFVEEMNQFLSAYLNSAYAYNRIFCGVIIEEWTEAWNVASSQSGKLITDSEPLVAELCAGMNEQLLVADQGSHLLYFELQNGLAVLKQECEKVSDAFASLGVTDFPVLPSLPFRQENVVSDLGPVFSVDLAEYVASDLFNTYFPRVASMQRLPEDMSVQNFLNTKRDGLLAAISDFNALQSQVELGVFSSLAAALMRTKNLPEKINPMVRALMNSVKGEPNADIQARSCAGLCLLFDLNISRGGKALMINDKLTKNLLNFLCNDPELKSDSSIDQTSQMEIKTLVLLEEEASKKEKSTSTRGRKKANKNADVTETLGNPSDLVSEEEDARHKEIRNVTFRGAKRTLQELCKYFGKHVFEKVPKLWEISSDPILTLAKMVREKSPEPSQLDALISSMFALENCAPFLNQSLLLHQIKELLPSICEVAQSENMTLRYATASCIASICCVMTLNTMKAIIEFVLPLMGESKTVSARRGAAECIYQVVKSMGDSILPYIVFLIVPTLRRMSDPDESVRFICTNLFAQLVKLVPLETGIPNPPGFSEDMIKHKDEERKFMGQLVGSEKVEDFQLNVEIKAELRPYQREGVNWLAFLNRYGLHGILCDDMGLGKTLQTICILASDHLSRHETYKRTKSQDSRPIQSVVVCPPSLTRHWVHEINKYAPSLNAFLYVGNKSARMKLMSEIRVCDVIVTSYDIMKNDLESVFEKMLFNYVVLDEGHVIKNPKTKLTKAVKSVKAFHRLILSGTPIQNNVLELWSLFDFLMPGLLGTEKVFNERFSKPILASRDTKSSSKEQERGALAMEGLHKQVLPFILRRMKEDVLHDLPPKIIQDYYCDLSDLQMSLYNQFGHSQGMSEVKHDITEESDSKSGKGKHVFQALQYVRKLCNHPLLVLNPSHPKFDEVNRKLKADGSTLHDIEHAPKLTALKQLLTDCGIGADTADLTVSPHRALIFVQLKTMMEIIENDLFAKHMPNVSYLRLDGSTDLAKRHDIVTRFNDDPSIDVLLLTTHVGGLGLNLTGADTVIFMEHDWNPMKDLQAMDRAHRIGQKRVVNVYRLITRGTLEEKIMGLQKFKLNIANSVINADNAGLSSMDTDQILDLFSVGVEKPKEGPSDPSKKVSAKKILEEMDEIWDESQYETLDVDDFLQSLK